METEWIKPAERPPTPAERPPSGRDCAAVVPGLGAADPRV
jgi:hypothetical protein